jgi:hypothetical protein
MTHRKSFPLTTRRPPGSVSFLVDSYLVTFLNFSKLTVKNNTIVAKQKVLFFTVNITRNRMQNPIIFETSSFTDNILIS